MQVNYHQQLQLDLTHDYFDGAFEHLALVPTKETAAKLQAKQILMSKHSNQIRFFTGSADGSSSAEASWLEAGEMTFEVIVTDPYFQNYTDIPMDLPTMRFAFTADKASGSFTRSTLDADIVLENERSIGALSIDPASYTANEIKLHFNARSVLWKYMIVVADSRTIVVQSVHIKPFNGVSFTQLPEEPLMDNQMATPLISNSPLKLKYTMEPPPELVVDYKDASGQMQQMEMKLPNPSVEYLKEGADDKLMVETIIYI